MAIQNDSVIPFNPFLYKYGLLISNDATTPNTILNIAAGQCRDVNNVIDMGVGSNFPPVNGNAAISAPLLLNAATTGANALDTGTFAASSMYAVYIIGDSRYINPVASLLSLASNATPRMPFGYDSYRIIGYWATDASVHFLKGYYAGQGSNLQFTYDAPQATAITAGAATVYTAVDLSALVPPVNNSPVVIQSNLTANAANDTLKLQGANSTGDAITIIAPVVGGTAHTLSYNSVLAQLVSSAPKINYKVSSASDAVALNVAGFGINV